MRHSFDAGLVMVAELTIASGKLDEFLAYTVPNLAVSRAYPGNLRFDMLIDETRPDTVLFHEAWASADAQQAYMAWRTQAGDLTRLMSFLARAPGFTALRRIAA